MTEQTYPESDRPVALVTGASRGIGAAIAATLGADHHIVVGGTNRELVDDVVTSLPSAQPFIVDLSDADAVGSAWAATGLETLDVLVHSAGVAWGAPVAEATLDQWREMFELNVFAVAELTRLTLPALRANTGHVIAINSGSGYTSRSGGALYSGTKFALRALTDALREEERGVVRVTSVHPGRVDTDMQVQLQRDLGNTEYDGSIYITAQAIADTVRLAVDMPASSMLEELSVRPVSA